MWQIKNQNRYKKQLSVFLFSMIALMACAQTSNNVIHAGDHLTVNQLKNYTVATFAAGCFSHEEALFESVRGVKEAVSRSADGTTTNQTHEIDETGNTGHATRVK